MIAVRNVESLKAVRGPSPTKTTFSKETCGSPGTITASPSSPFTNTDLSSALSRPPMRQSKSAAKPFIGRSSIQMEHAQSSTLASSRRLGKAGRKRPSILVRPVQHEPHSAAPLARLRSGNHGCHGGHGGGGGAPPPPPPPHPTL